MSTPKIYKRSYRLRKAYATTFIVMISYLWLSLRGKIFGESYYKKRIAGLHLKNANRIKKAIMELQGLFIKIGQMLSILTNFLPPAFQEPLEALQDQIPARPFAEIQQRISEELGKPPKELFQSFSERSLASASIGQVHRATLKDGTEVAVKVQHANIEKVAGIDLEIMRRLVKLLSWWMDIKGMEYAYTQVKLMIEEELDFKQEAQSMTKIQENLKNESGLLVPQVHPEYSTGRVLTTTFHEGVKISNVAQLDNWGIDRRAVAEKLLQAYCQMVLEDRFYHADPHPGNILIQKNGSIVLLDFGAVATLQAKMRTGLLQLVEAVAKNDTDKIIEAMQTMEILANQKDAEKIAEKMVNAFRSFLQNEVQFDGLNLKDIKIDPFNSSLFGLIQEIGLKQISSTVQVPKDYVLLNRMITLLLGIVNSLDHHVNPMEIVRPYLRKFLLGQQGDPIKFVTKLVQQTLTNMISLPGELRKTLNKVKTGELEVQVEGTRERTQLLYLLGQQVVYSLLLIAALGMAYLLEDRIEGPQSRHFWVAGSILLLLLLRSMWKARQIRK